MLQQTPEGRLQIERSIYWTAKNQHATSGSRAAWAADLTVGDVVQMDPANHEGKGVHNTCAVPTTGFMGELFVVTKVSPEVNLIDSAAAPTQRRGGTIRVVPISFATQAKVASTVASVGLSLQVKDDTTHLQVGAPTTVAHLLDLVGATNATRPVAIAYGTQGAVTALLNIGPFAFSGC